MKRTTVRSESPGFASMAGKNDCPHLQLHRISGSVAAAQNQKLFSAHPTKISLVLVARSSQRHKTICTTNQSQESCLIASEDVASVIALFKEPKGLILSEKSCQRKYWTGCLW
ncbi:hypothetical protein [Parasphingorhabdus sp.]|uniref:hypothetical protein n=1 Tax=Parasphingorhabdus sp. TaxID=2709688 RepID=UPI003BB1F1DE